MPLDANTQIRVLLTMRACSISKLAKLLTEKTGKKCSHQNLSNKLRKGTIRYDEMLVIADILGFEIKFRREKIFKILCPRGAVHCSA